MAAVHSRYARAFADVVLEHKLDVRQALEQLLAIAALLKESPQLRNVWENPSVPAEQKRKLLDSLAERLGATRWVRNFVAVIIDHHRIAALPQIAQQFQEELNQRLGMTEAEVVTARELSEQERSALEAQVARLTGKKVMARYQRDPKVLGGAIIRVGSTIYDGSVKGQLQRLKEELSAG